MVDARLFTDARIFTGRRYVESLLVEDGRVVVAGTSAETRRQAPTGVEVERLERRLVVPGLVDAHLHLGELARLTEQVDLTSARSVDELLAGVGGWATEHAGGAIVGQGWHADRLKERRAPTLRELDAALPDRPTILFHESRHAALLNSAALSLPEVAAALNENTPGTVGRTHDDRPDGLLYEEGMRAIGPYLERLAPLTADRLAAVIGRLAEVGITRVGAMSVGREEADALRSLAAGRQLEVSVRAYVRLARLDELPSDWIRRPFGPFSIVGVKAFVDGAFGPRTAALSEPYLDFPDTLGDLVGDDRDLAEGLARAGDGGLAPAVHAIGDRAIVRACRLLGSLPHREGPPARVEHAALTTPAVLSELDAVRPTLVVQPGFLWSDWWLPSRLGPERSRWAYLFRSLRDRGHAVAGSSDAPCDPVDPWRGLRATIDRRDPLGRSANPVATEALAPEEAISLYTKAGAAALGDAGEGELEPGRSADLLVLQVPRLAAALRAGVSPVRETWVAGHRLAPARARATV